MRFSNLAAGFVCLLLASCAFGQTNKIVLQSGVELFAPNLLDELPTVAASEIQHDKYYRFVHFAELPRTDQRQQLAEAGIELFDYLPYNTWVAAVPTSATLQTLKMAGIDGLYQIEARHKLSRILRSGNYPDYAMKEAGRLDLKLRYFPNTVPAELLAELGMHGIQVLSAAPHRNLFTVRVEMHRIDALVAINSVMWLETIAPPGVPEDEIARGFHRNNALDAEYGAGRHFNGEGVSVCVYDDGFVGPHIDFQQRTEQSSVLQDMAGTHGDMTAGILGGAGNLDPRKRGMATGAYLHIKQYDAAMLGSDTLYQQHDVVIFSTSYSNGCNAGYTTTTELMDATVRENPSMLHVFSAGNSNNNDCDYGAGDQWGNITGGHKAAKNVVAVANLLSTGELVSSSSRGPAHDGRLKPDLAANGNGQYSTDPDNSYAEGSGTSAACPGVSGVSAQLYQAYRAMHNNQNPESALIKACLMNSADDLGNPGPDFKFGWGRINGLRAVEALENQTYWLDSVSQGASISATLSIPAGVAEARIMLYWMDPEASPAAGMALINNLDLAVTDPGNSSHLPLVLDHTPDTMLLNSAAAPGVDSLNNVEQVRLHNPAAGQYTIEVNGTSVPEGPQRYYILYEFRTPDVRVTYPLGGEGFAPNDTLAVRWEAVGDTVPFTVEWSANNGTTWDTLAAAVPGTERHLFWTAPDTVTGQGWVRVSRAGQAAMGEQPFSIIGAPEITVDFVCPDSIGFHWTPINGANEYHVFMLDSAYMELVDSTGSISYTLYNLSPFGEYWVAVRARGQLDARGRRGIASSVGGELVTCNLQFDAEIAVVQSPPAGGFSNCFGSSAPVQLRVVNHGFDPISGITAHYQFDNGPVVSEALSGSINPGDTLDHQFAGQLDLSVVGSFPFEAWLTASTDNNVYNDSVAFSIAVLTDTVVRAPYNQDFEQFEICTDNNGCEIDSCTLSEGWYNELNGAADAIDWRTYSGETPSSATGPTIDHAPGTALGQYLYLEASGECYDRVALAVSPCLELTQTTDPQLSFWYHMLGSEMGELHVDVFDGSEWLLDVVPPKVNNAGVNWQEETIDLNPWTSQTIKVRFRGITGDGFRSDMAIDDISLTGFLWPAAVQDMEGATSIYAYPNPTDGRMQLVLEGVSAGTVQWRIVDLLGHQVDAGQLSCEGDQVEVPIELPGQASGIYLLEVVGDRFRHVQQVVVR